MTVKIEDATSESFTVSASTCEHNTDSEENLVAHFQIYYDRNPGRAMSLAALRDDTPSRRILVVNL